MQISALTGPNILDTATQALATPVAQLTHRTQYAPVKLARNVGFPMRLPQPRFGQKPVIVQPLIYTVAP